jgi:phosphocarrier protein
MSERTVTVASPVGLHARPAAIFVKAVAATGLAVRMSRPESTSIDGRSILAVLSLNVGCGEEVVLSVDGPQEETLDRLAALLASDLDGANEPAGA